MPTAQTELPARLYAGLYVRTQKQKRFWGWSSQGWGSLRNTETHRPLRDLASWLRLAHERLDSDRAPVAVLQETPRTAATMQLNEPQPRQQLRKSSRLQFVCNRHMIGLLIR